MAIINTKSFSKSQRRNSGNSASTGKRVARSTRIRRVCRSTTTLTASAKPATIARATRGPQIGSSALKVGRHQRPSVYCWLMPFTSSAIGCSPKGVYYEICIGNLINASKTRINWLVEEQVRNRFQKRRWNDGRAWKDLTLSNGIVSGLVTRLMILCRSLWELVWYRIMHFYRGHLWHVPCTDSTKAIIWINSGVAHVMICFLLLLWCDVMTCNYDNDVPDLVLLTADLPTLLGVASGIFVLAGLLCMVLHLYTRARFHPTHLADARLTPPCLYSLNDTGAIWLLFLSYFKVKCNYSHHLYPHDK